ncbi:MAG: TolB-like 6-bladed beta-propeller domain-containing protein [Bacteroidales bacterium]|jgi:hypothetical protein|nr:TolB-like 6-bladed beta-propeller domain-containing protein [Bacteroidales bacterium]
MKKYINSLFLFLLFILCAACKNTNVLDITQNVTKIDGNLLLMDCLVGRPYNITTIDTLLIFYDYTYDGKLVTVYDMKNNKCMGRFVSEGNGPNEMLPPLSILRYPQKDKLFAFNDDLRSLFVFEVPSMNIQNKILFPSEGLPKMLGKMKDYYVAMGYWEKGRFGIYDREANLLRTDGKYPFRGEQMGEVQSFFTYQGQITTNPNDNYFAIGSSFSDNIEFYEVKADSTVLLNKYESFDAKVQYYERGEARGIHIEDDCINTYVWSYGTDKYCYMLYSGKENSEENSNMGNKIVVFDWTGNYIKTLETSSDVRTFCVDESNSNIYGIVKTDDGEFGIMHFNFTI